MDPARVSVQPLSGALVDPLRAHLGRHRAESGAAGDLIFMPFEPDGDAGPRGLDRTAWQMPLDQPGWQRWYVALGPAGTVVGHVDLKGDGLATGLHRCELGIGIERAHRGGGLGQRLMGAALAFARQAPTLAWVDLRVFAHNHRARALYEALGFERQGTLRDRFRIRGEQIDDDLMALSVESF
jgi:RimJ/RimL family protein N-acetyltransferase